MFTAAPSDLPVGMPTRLLYEARYIAERGGVAILGRAVVFGELDRNRLPTRIRSTAPTVDPNRLPLLSAHPGYSTDPEGPEYARVIARCATLEHTPYGIDVCWQLEENVTAYERLVDFIDAGHSGLSYEGPLEGREVQPIYTHPDARTRPGQPPVLTSYDVRGVRVAAVALVDEPGFFDARVSAVLTPRAAFVLNSASCALEPRWDRDAADPGNAADRALWPLVEGRERAKLAGRILPTESRVGVRRRHNIHGNLTEGLVIDHNRPTAAASRASAAEVGGGVIEYGPVMPFSVG